MIKEFFADCRSELIDMQSISVWHVMKAAYEAKGLKALFAYRLGRELLKLRSRPLLWPLLLIGWPVYFLISFYARIVYGIRIELSAKIGPGLYIGHFGDIVLRQCTLGEKCSIAQSVHIAPAYGSAAGPQLGDRVWVGAHASVIGNYKIGSGSTISAGAVVQRDFPEKTLCMGNPARIVFKDYDNSQILRNIE
jgi:serine O-acetyltransferase